VVVRVCGSTSCRFRKLLFWFKDLLVAFFLNILAYCLFACCVFVWVLCIFVGLFCLFVVCVVFKGFYNFPLSWFICVCLLYNTILLPTYISKLQHKVTIPENPHYSSPQTAITTRAL